MGPPTGGGGKPPPNFNGNTNQPPNPNWQPPNPSQQYQRYHQPSRTNSAPQEQSPYRGQFDEQLPPSMPQQHPYEPTRNQDYSYGAMNATSAIPRPQTVPSNQGASYQGGSNQGPSNRGASYQGGSNQGASYQEDYDETDRGHNINVNVNYQEVADATPNIFTSFLVNRLDHDGHDVPQRLRRHHEGNNE